jgi:hypothetical protein
VLEPARVELSAGRRVVLRPIEAEDDGFILDTAGDRPGARATALVGRCLNEGEAAARALAVGDREAVLLHLRRLTFGESMECLLRCPVPACAEPLELTLRVSDLLAPAERDAGAIGELSADIDGAHFVVSFRRPTAGDLDEAAALASTDADAAGRFVLERCLIHAARDRASIPLSAMPEALRSAVEDAMAARDAQAEIVLAMSCPSCGAAFSASFDTATFLLRELDERATRTLREVHALAQHYHWSEVEILRMPARRRAQYLELVRDSRASGRSQ